MNQEKSRRVIKSVCFTLVGVAFSVLAYFLGVHGIMISAAIIGGAIIIGWGAELLELVLPSGVAIAIIALLQISPEFFVEWATVKRAAADPSFISNAMANLYGSNKLLVGFGPPLVFFVYYFFSPYRHTDYINFPRIKSFNIFALNFALFYNLIIYLKGNLMWYDSIFLIGIYFWSILYIGRKEILFDKAEKASHQSSGSAVEKTGGEADHPTEGHDGFVERQLQKFIRVGETISYRRVYFAAFVLLGLGGFLLIRFAEPFLEALVEAAAVAGISTFFVIQYIAPFMSEFPEKIVAIGFAAKGKEDTAMINFLSSILSQLTLLTAMIPLAFSYYKGNLTGIEFNALQKQELLLVIIMTSFSFMLFSDLKFTPRECLIALGMFLWQFFFPESRKEITMAYFVLFISYFLEMVLEKKHTEVLNTVIGNQNHVPKAPLVPPPGPSISQDK